MNSMAVILAVAISVCHGATFNNAGGTQCWIPTWKCDCKIVYDCDGDGEFPNSDVVSDAAMAVAGYVKDLAPDTYPLEMPGKRWRHNKYRQEEYCKRECRDRMNAFLCLEANGEFSDFSNSAVCTKLLGLAMSPFAQDGTAEPCCAIYLQYGPAWCEKKWHEEIGTLRCLTLSAVDFTAGAPGATSTHVFSVEGGCTDDTTTSFNWCDSAPSCTGPPPT